VYKTKVAKIQPFSKKIGYVIKTVHFMYREPKSPPFRSTTMGPYFGKILNGSQWREATNILISFELCTELHMMFVNLKDTF